MMNEITRSLMDILNKIKIKLLVILFIIIYDLLQNTIAKINANDTLCDM